MNKDLELENIQIDMDIARIQREDAEYLKQHPDPYADVDFRTAKLKCPLCRRVMPYRGCAFHFETHMTDSWKISQDACFKLTRDAEMFLVKE
jgi:hypothetical protein